MFICNLKMNGKKLSKIVIILAIIFATILLGFSIFSIIKSSDEQPETVIDNANIVEITSADYTNFLKECHDNIDDYIDMKIKMVGYVYRMADFNDNQFVLSRTMVLNSANSGVVVGILAESEKASMYQDYEWVEVVGQITRGNYKGEMPILKVIEINKCDIPEDEYVYPPTF